MISEIGAGEESSSDESWMRVSDGLIAGVHHTLNNRMAALGAVAQVLEADLAADHPLAGAMSAELQRLESTVSLLSLLTSDEGAEPVQLEFVTAEAAKLFAMHHSLRDLRLEVKLAGDIYPLWIPPGVLRRALMVMLTIAGRHARASGSDVELTATGDAKIVAVRVKSVGGRGGGPAAEEESGLTEVGTRGAAALLRPWGGSVEEEAVEEGISLRAELLTLPEARSREAAGGL